MTTDPLLSNPPAFVLLAMAVALAAYLRQVVEGRDKLREEIEEGKHSNFPEGKAHTIRKLQHLEDSRARLNRVAPVVIALTLAVSARLLLHSAVALWGWTRLLCWDQRLVFGILDFAICLWIFCLLVALWYMHEKGKRTDEEIRILKRAWQKDNGPKVPKT